MTEPEGFLTRWSRLKREDVHDPAAEPRDSGTQPTPPDEGAAPQPTQARTVDPVVDLTKLPSLESITANTDIGAFLTPGVPEHLKHAALRRAWSADPAIRDFVGLAENAWDFTATDGVRGFGPLSPADVARALAQFVGEEEPPRPAAETSGQVRAEDSALSIGTNREGAGEHPVGCPPVPCELPEEVRPAPAAPAAEPPSTDIAMQNPAAGEDRGSEPSPRGHGGAVPR